MSTLENTIFLEGKKEEFEEILANKEWWKISSFQIDLEEKGFSKEVVNLSFLMSDDDVREYRKWDEKTNGNTETQMDDNSDNI